MKANALAKIVLGYLPGIQKHYAAVVLHLAGSDFTAPALEALFQELITAVAAVAAAEQQRADAVKTAAAALVKVQPVAKAFKQTVLAAFAGQAAILGDFNLEPAKTTALTAQEKADAASKAMATRKALGTKGPQQKKDAKKALAAGAAAPAVAPTEPAPVGATTAPAAGPTSPSKS